jgi:hypothetical protein
VFTLSNNPGDAPARVVNSTRTNTLANRLSEMSIPARIDDRLRPSLLTPTPRKKIAWTEKQGARASAIRLSRTVFCGARLHREKNADASM